MRIFLAGATGVIGTRLLPLMLAEGYVVAAMTRTREKINGLHAAGVTPVLCNLFDQRWPVLRPRYLLRGRSPTCSPYPHR